MQSSAKVQRDSSTVLDAFRKIVRALRVASRAAEKGTGLSGAQLFVLQKLSDGDAISLTKLAARTMTHQSSVSVVVQRLVDRKLITRKASEMDGRRIELSLTAAGSKTSKNTQDLAQDRLIRALHAMPAAKRAQLATLLDDVLLRAGLAETPAAFFFEDDLTNGAKSRAKKIPFGKASLAKPAVTRPSKR